MTFKRKKDASPVLRTDKLRPPRDKGHIWCPWMPVHESTSAHRRLYSHVTSPGFRGVHVTALQDLPKDLECFVVASLSPWRSGVSPRFQWGSIFSPPMTMRCERSAVLSLAVKT